ncbi:MAG: M20 family metallopeptidase [Prolixibacteraceae bacterium]
MWYEDVVALTRKLISFNTVNPPGNEREIALFTGGLLEKSDFEVRYIPFGENRLHVIAEKGCGHKGLPVLFTGHFDTVPPGARSWSVDVFGGEIREGKLFGRGSSDMKGGLAAMVVAAVTAFQQGSPVGGVRLILTAGEELGCQGAKRLVESGLDLGRASGIIVGEPTSNIPAIGHKGGLYLNLTTTGVTAHSSMPHLGDNAVYKAARAVLAIEKFDFGVGADPLLGLPTINVGKFSGGMNINSVPDHAAFTIDARTTTKVDHRKLLGQLKAVLGEEVSVETLVDLMAVSTDENDPFVQLIYRICGIRQGDPGFPRALPYLTDGSVLQVACGGVPTVILGPGEPEMAHQTDEYCYLSKLEQAVEIYRRIILKED